MQTQTKEIFETIACPLCGSGHYRTSVEGVSAPFVREKTGIVECEGCRLKYMNPRPTEECFLAGYSQSDEKGLYDAEEGDRRVNFELYLSRIEGMRPQKGRILDVGCCRGYFVKLAKERGWDSFGLEPSRKMADDCAADGLNVYNGTILNSGIEDGQFDVVTLWDVIEHLREPLEEFQALNRLIRKGGLVCFWTKNIESLRARILGRRYPFIMSQHIVYFSPDTSRLLLEKSGFRLRRIFTLPMLMSIHRILNRLGFKRDFRSPFIRNLTLPVQFGDNMLVIAEKL